MRATTVKVQRWSDGLAVRLPSTVVRDMRLAPGQSILVTCRGGIITMKPTPKREPSLRDKVRMPDGLLERLARFDPKRHGREVMVTRRRGKEAM